MSELKTKPTLAKPTDFIATVSNETRKADAFKLLEIMTRLSGCEPKMWGDTLIGYGEYHYKYASGHEGDFMRTGFSPRKANLVVYIIPGYSQFSEILSRLGKHKLGKSCLYINKLADVDMVVLEELIRAGLDEMAQKYPQ
jgi:hypothetical protein